MTAECRRRRKGRERRRGLSGSIDVSGTFLFSYSIAAVVFFLCVVVFVFPDILREQRQFRLMAETKPLIGLKWEPKFPGLSLESKTGSKGPAESHESSSLWASKSDLVDGICLPPTDPRKINKMIRKQLKDTAGSNWFDMPAPTMTPELKRDLQLLKLRTVMDPSHHYKKSVSRSKLAEKYFQVGTVIEPAQEMVVWQII